MTLTVDKGRERVEQLERAARSAFGPQILSGMWSDGQIAWKVYLGKERGTFYESTRDDVSEAAVLNMIRAIRDKKSVGTGGSRVDAKADTEIHYVEKDAKKSWWQKGSPRKNQVKRTEVVETKPEIVIDEEDRLRAEELGIKTKDINAGGGTRKDENGDSYWLDLKQLIELDELDKSISDNEEFYTAFAELRERHGIKASKKKVKWNDSYTSKSDGYMSSWWKGWGYDSGGSELSRRLAVALGVINTTVQVINNTSKRWRVSLATEEEGNTGVPVSYTSYDEQMVVVSPSALLDTSLDEQKQIEITTGYGLHEASHTEYSESLMKALTKPTPLKPMAVAGMLHNILEDVRIEGLTSEKFPGFAGFFDTMNAYLWKIAVSTIKIEGWGPELTDKLNAIVRFAKWPVESEPWARADKELSVEFDWFRTWVDDYISGGMPMRESVQRAIDHLMEDSKTKQQMQNQAAAEAAMGMLKEMAEEAFGQMLGEAMKKLGEKGQLGQPCPSPTTPDKMAGSKPGQPKQPMLSSDVGAEVEQLIREEFRIDNPDLPEQFQSQKGHVPEVQVSKPESGTLAKMPPNPLLQRLKHAFRFRKARPMYSNRLMRSGSLDEDEMWRVLSSDTRIFEQRVIEDDPDTQITMLIDSSGSMNGDNIERASFLARIMLECLKDMKGIRCRVRAHSSSYHPGTYKGVSTVFRIWEPGDDIERVQVAKRVGMQGNYDAYAIAWCCNELLKNQRPGEDMVLFVLSDGRPNGAGLAGMDGIKEVRTMVDHFTKKGITIIQIAIDRSVGEGYQRQMYDNYIRYLDDQSLPGQLTQMLIKLFSAND